MGEKVPVLYMHGYDVHEALYQNFEFMAFGLWVRGAGLA